MVTMSEVRELALSLTETEELEHWGKPSFRVRNKIYAVIQPDSVSLVIKTTKDDQTVYTSMFPDVFRIPESFANLAYMTIRMDRIDKEDFRHLLIKAWKLVSPKNLAKEMKSE